MPSACRECDDVCLDAHEAVLRERFDHVRVELRQGALAFCDQA
jgi:hypothetical protein